MELREVEREAAISVVEGMVDEPMVGEEVENGHLENVDALTRPCAEVKPSQRLAPSPSAIRPPPTWSWALRVEGAWP